MQGGGGHGLHSPPPAPESGEASAWGGWGSRGKEGAWTKRVNTLRILGTTSLTVGRGVTDTESEETRMSLRDWTAAGYSEASSGFEYK